MKKLLAMALCVLLALSCLSFASAEEEITYPIDTDVTLKVWMGSAVGYSAIYPSANDAPWYQEWEKRTGIDVDWIEPAAGADKTQAYNLMMPAATIPI